jgi:ABC-2 type transport system permease protein
MSAPGSIAWFAAEEARLAWRDWLSLMTGGYRRRVRTVALGLVVYALMVHGLAYLILTRSGHLTGPINSDILVAITGALMLAWSLMLSQALETVTRAFYARGDLELILTSPVASSRLFGVRIAAMTGTILSMVLILGAPFIDVLVWLGGPHWLAAFVVAMALSLDAVAIAVAIVAGLFRVIGPKRTRAVSQIIAAVMGGAFAIGIQFIAILSMGKSTVPRLATLVKWAPGIDNPIWWPARAAFGQPWPMAALLALSVAALAASIRVFAPRFGALALATNGLSSATTHRDLPDVEFHSGSAGQVLRRKEWILLLRDPWLMSQTLMQLLYLLPAGFLLWRNFYRAGHAGPFLVPILIVTAGQLAGGLAWLAVSGEDAPDLIASAPVSAGHVVRAKTEAVLAGIGLIFGPFVVALAFTEPFAALVSLIGAIVAACSATAIQYWFRMQAKRSLFRRRQVSSRIATFAEALSSTGWAGTGALAATGTWLAIIPGTIVLAILASAWMISPRKNPAFA